MDMPETSDCSVELQIRRCQRPFARHMETELGHVNVERFPDGEIFVQYRDQLRTADVFIIQPTCNPPNENIMELLIMLDAARRASAARITAVIPFFGYARQDRKDRPRVPITAKLVAKSSDRRRSKPHIDHGPSRTADPGLLRYSGGSPLCGARHTSLPSRPS